MPGQSPKGTTTEPKWSCDGQGAAWFPNRTPTRTHSEPGEVHDGFDEDGVVADV